MSYEPKITRLCDGIAAWIAAESKAGRITPAIVSYPTLLDLETHESYPALAVRHMRETPQGDGRTMQAQVNLHLWLEEARSAMAPPAVANLVWQVLGALEREFSNYGIGAHLMLKDIHYSPLFDGRDEAKVLRGARIEMLAQYHEVHGETT